ncbi:hypothetical protein Dimus_010010 [Dionaea muscipula]
MAEPLPSTLPTYPQLDYYLTSITEDIETICWGCGLRLILPSQAPVFKCGWCGAVTNKNSSQHDSRSFRWRRFRDRVFVYVVIIFMLFVICGGMWAVYPVVFSISVFCGAFHSVLTCILSVVTMSMFLLAAFKNPGNPPTLVWGSYPAISRHDLDNYTFCHYCKKPKSPRTHHCRSCGMCVLDMDHHCPFIGNCVGAANHHYFISFLISAITSMIYVTVMSAACGLRVLPALGGRSFNRPRGYMSKLDIVSVIRAIAISITNSEVLLSPRGLVLIYLFMASLSVEIGLVVLLWQQLCFIYQGKTYLSNLSSQKEEETGGEKDCLNLYRFFGFPTSALRYFPSFCNSKKIHRK